MSAPHPRTLVVEDEPAIRRGPCDAPARHGHEPASAGDEGSCQALAGRFDLVVLALVLPGVDGLAVCRTLRAHAPRLSILMLTARGAEEDVLEGFRCGSDGYATKPLPIAQAVARIDALLRRTGQGAPAPQPFPFGAWRVEPARLAATRDGVSIELSRRELEILRLLALERGRIVGRQRLLAEVWGCAAPERIETRTVDVHIAKLRRKLGPDGRRLIETVRGEGYRLPA